MWGGSSPETSFDCSGFVSYVLTNSGLYNTGRLGAQGLYNISTRVSNPQPGDLVFFTILSEAKVYVGTYGKYNNGSLSGAWLDLSDYSDKEEFYEACRELHKDEEDAEYMFQDWDRKFWALYAMRMEYRLMLTALSWSL